MAKNPFTRVRDPYTREALEYLSQLDEVGKRTLLFSMRGFIRGYAPHNTTAKVIPFVARNAIQSAVAGRENATDKP